MKGNSTAIERTSNSVVAEPAQPLRAQQAYQPPTLLRIGRAVDLVLSYSYGKYSDGYTGYYWER